MDKVAKIANRVNSEGNKEDMGGVMIRKTRIRCS
jgi:hypothetical protein